MSQSKEILYQTFHNKLKTLLEQAECLIQAAKETASYHEELASQLSITVDDLQKASEHVLIHSENENLKFDAWLVKNVLHDPLFSKSSPLSLHTAAKHHQTTRDSSQLKEIIFSLAKNSKHTDVMLDNLKDIYVSFHEEMKKEG
jgi:hypothetical protein